MFDRRERERRVRRLRVTLERRQRQRRAEPDAMWQTHSFIVVETTHLPIQAIQLDATAGSPGSLTGAPLTAGSSSVIGTQDRATPTRRPQ
jgi:hypothetical protein